MSEPEDKKRLTVMTDRDIERLAWITLGVTAFVVGVLAVWLG